MPNSACQNQLPQFSAAAKAALFSGRHTAGCWYCTIHCTKFLPFVQAAESPPPAVFARKKDNPREQKPHRVVQHIKQQAAEKPVYTKNPPFGQATVCA